MFKFFCRDTFSPPVDGTSFAFRIIQGNVKSVTGNYGDQGPFISVEDSGIDLSQVTLSINGVPIDPVTSPVNGFMLFYYDGVMYVKIFKGTDVVEFDGLSYVLTYVTCDGIYGNVDVEAFTSFDSTLYDANGRVVQYTLSNEL